MQVLPEDTSKEAWSLGISSAVMSAIGYPGESLITGGLTFRGLCFCFSFAVFLFIVHKLLLGLKYAISKEENPEVASMLNQVSLATVVSCCTYTVAYFFPFFNIGGAQAVDAIQCGHCVSDVICASAGIH